MAATSSVSRNHGLFFRQGPLDKVPAKSYDQIFSYLPFSSLINFSQTSFYSRKMINNYVINCFADDRSECLMVSIRCLSNTTCLDFDRRKDMDDAFLTKLAPLCHRVRKVVFAGTPITGEQLVLFASHCKDLVHVDLESRKDAMCYSEKAKKFYPPGLIKKEHVEKVIALCPQLRIMNVNHCSVTMETDRPTYRHKRKSVPPGTKPEFIKASLEKASIGERKALLLKHYFLEDFIKEVEHLPPEQFKAVLDDLFVENPKTALQGLRERHPQITFIAN